MIRPLLHSRVVELYDRASLRINTREITAFMKVAVDTCKREILQVIGSPMFFRGDVFYLELGNRRLLLR